MPDDGSQLFFEDSLWAIKEGHIPEDPEPATLPNGQYIRFNSYNFPTDYLRHTNFEVWRRPDDNSDIFWDDSTFIVRAPGLAGGQSLSFESVNHPGYYLYHDADLVNVRVPGVGQERPASWYLIPTDVPNFFRVESEDWVDNYIRHTGDRAKLQTDDGTQQFNDDALWTVEYTTPRETTPAPEADPVLPIGDVVQFESMNYPTEFLRNEYPEVWRRPDDGTTPYKEDTSYYVRQGLDGVGPYSFESYTRPGEFLKHDGDPVNVGPVTPGEEPMATWYARPADEDYIRLESSDRPGDFIRHSGDRAYLHSDDGSGFFNLDSSWKVREPTFPVETTPTSPGIVNPGSRYGFEEPDNSGNFWRHDPNGSIHPTASDPITDQDYLFDVVPGLAGGDSISFRSVNNPTMYLTHSNGNLDIASGSGQPFNNEASFYEREGFYGVGGVSFESVSNPG
mmetsp:Transcript_13491/g.13223  ORF Transcript_13491/g.13223 Transcript_13491/m.13223 type:complete len:450 (+) Transcript_13491:1152-2501(+)